MTVNVIKVFKWNEIFFIYRFKDNNKKAVYCILLISVNVTFMYTIIYKTTPGSDILPIPSQVDTREKKTTQKRKLSYLNKFWDLLGI